MPADLRSIRKCTGCNAPIVWAETSTGRAMPVDADPVPDGNVLLFPTIDRKWLAVVLGADEAQASRSERHKSHFATCPVASRFRKPVKAGGRK